MPETVVYKADAAHVCPGCLVAVYGRGFEEGLTDREGNPITELDADDHELDGERCDECGNDFVDYGDDDD